jgi:hypothetical protein
VSRWYLIALANIQSLQGDGDLRHLQPDEYYKHALGKGGRKRTAALALEDDAGLDGLARLLDAPAAPAKREPEQKKAKHDATAAGAARTIHPKTHRWGAALLTFAEKATGKKSWQATCHRLHSHKPVGNQKGICRKTVSVTLACPDEIALKLVKLWVARAANHPTRVQHKNLKPTQSQLPENDEELEMMKPPEDYNSDDGREVPEEVREAPAAHPARARRGRGQAKAKAHADVLCRGRGRGSGRGRRIIAESLPSLPAAVEPAAVEPAVEPESSIAPLAAAVDCPSDSSEPASSSTSTSTDTSDSSAD